MRRSSLAVVGQAATVGVTILLILIFVVKIVQAAPFSKPFIAYRTDPFDQNVHHELAWDETEVKTQQNIKNSRVFQYDGVPAAQCPLQLSIGLAKKLHYSSDDGSNAVKQPPVLQTVFPARGPGKQVIYSTAYEHVDLLSPAVLEGTYDGRRTAATTTSAKSPIKEALLQASDYPILFESSAFSTTSPILHDVNGDGIMDIIVADYEGGISVSAVAGSPRYFHHTQIPRLYVRRSWVEGRVNASLPPPPPPPVEQPKNDTKPSRYHPPPNDPYHSYFEFYYSAGSNDELIRGQSANVLEQKSEDAVLLKERRSKEQNVQATSTVQQRRLQVVTNENNEKVHDEQQLKVGEETLKDEHIQLAHSQEDGNRDEHKAEHGEEERAQHEKDGAGDPKFHDDDEQYRIKANERSLVDDLQIPELDETDRGTDDLTPLRADRAVVDDLPINHGGVPNHREDDAVPRSSKGYDMEGGDDMSYGRRDRYEMMDDYYYASKQHDLYGQNEHTSYYDAKNYIRLPPHILTTPVLAEVPKLYGNNHDKEDILLVPVSYYLDEDDYEGFFPYKRFVTTDEGDETETRRGTFVASAIMAYILGESGRWSGQTHLDLSTDFSAPENVTVVGALPIRSDSTKMGAFALSSPTVADLDGDGSYEVIVGTSMGMVYAFDARQMFKRENWPVQMKRPVEHRILVEDVIGNTDLEVFVSDIGGTVVCLNSKAQILWHRNLPVLLNLPHGAEISASSPMTLGDINGDGWLDLVQVIRINKRSFIFAVTAATGDDLPGFPIELDGVPGVDDASGELHQKLPQPLLVDLHTDQSFLNDYLRRNGTAWKQRQPSPIPALHGGSGPGLHIVQPHGTDLFIVEGYSGCTQKISIGEEISAMVQVDDVHATNKLDLVIATESGNIVTLESMASYHPLNTWTGGEVRGRSNLHAHGYSATQGIFVHAVSRQFADIFGVYVPVTFEIFDNRPNIQNEPDKRKYVVEIRDGPSWLRVLWRNTYTEPGVYTDRVYIRYGPGYYTLFVTLQTSHGLIYEDTFSIGYNVKFLDGFGILLWLPLLVSAIAILMCGAKKSNWDDDEFDGGREGRSLGILGRSLPT